MVHIDFSENYACKYSDEIQSMHFGGSRNQLSLHTGVIYLRDEVIPICTVSDFLRHDPAGIWAHLTPILKYVTEDRNLTSIHFISDGPTTQYRNKNNIYLWGHKIAEYGFKKSTWNFLEAAHGKGAADGVGAAVKRAADQQVILKKNDITCAKDFFQLFSGGTSTSTVKMFLVEENELKKGDAELPSDLRPIPSTMKIHQMIIEGPDSFATRVVSCFCKHPTKLLCDCYQPDTHQLPPRKLPADDEGEQLKQATEETSTVKTSMVEKASSIQNYMCVAFLKICVVY
ncbi:uncharacterized protein LOC127853150 [Dreissena polymorpha]|uniref:uncharacterized protein LOC127853150 n=1 Tax=Dreissena polymorpha TaxID=45954 RepID=UPI002265229D|nr:uncharacterized protein LOC127853150 [Dreissena polymorpha]